MAELYPSDAELNTLSGTTDSEQEVLFVTTGESPYYNSFYKMLYRLLDSTRRAGDLRVFKDGDLTFGVRAGKFFNDDTTVDFSQTTGESLANNATNYIYLTAAGTLTVSTTGFPVPSVTSHIPLATIVTAGGEYEHGDITDYRGRAFLTICGAAGGNINALDWQESVLDELDFTAAEPAAPLGGDRYLNTGSGASSVTGQTVAANDIEEWNGTNWTEITPTEGACCLVEDRDMLIGYNGAAWVDLGTFANIKDLTDGGDADSLHTHNGKLSDVADDTTPQLGADLDVNGKKIVSTANGDVLIQPNGSGGVGLGQSLTVSGDNAVAEGNGVTASGTNAHAEGGNTEASGACSHAEGFGTVAGAGDYAHAEGNGTTASGASSHAEGDGATASNSQAHAEGNGTVASGLRSHAEGMESQATGSYTHAEGHRSKARLIGQRARAAGKFASVGDCQDTDFQLRGSTTDANFTELTSPERFTLEDEHSYACTVTIHGRQDTGGDHAMYKRMVIIERTGGTVALAGAVQTIGTDIESDGNWDIQLTADDVNKSLKVEVKGAAATNVRWTALIETVELGYAD